MVAWSLPQPLLLGAVAAVATTVTWLHGRSQQALAEDEEDQPDDEPRPKRQRWSHSRSNKWESTWGEALLHIRSARAAGSPDERAEAKFKLRFRLPFDLFEEIVAELRGRPGYVASNDIDSRIPRDGRDARTFIPLDIMLMAVLRIAGRGWCFDDVEESSGIGLSTMAAYYHNFVRQYVDDFYSDWVFLAETPEQIEEVTNAYEVQGFPGCVGSVDCVHMQWGRCEFSQRHAHIGKEGFPTRAYEVIVDAVRRVRSVTPGFPGALNDKTIVRHDHAINKMRGIPANPGLPAHNIPATPAIPGIYEGVAFRLRDSGGEFQRYTGLYLIADGGRSPKHEPSTLNLKHQT
jgi:hypothetical protein